VHRSNFRIEGFTEQPSLAELVAIGRERKILVIEDLGSGYVGLPGEPGGAAMDRVLAASRRFRPAWRRALMPCASAVTSCWAARRPASSWAARRSCRRVRAHPLMRAIRVDKLTYAALEATLAEYLAGRAGRTVPVLRAIACSAADIEQRARAVLDRAGARRRIEAELVDGASTIGGARRRGLRSDAPHRPVGPRHDRREARRALRALEPPVIARIENDRLLLDLRTVLPDEDDFCWPMGSRG